VKSIKDMGLKPRRTVRVTNLSHVEAARDLANGATTPTRATTLFLINGAYIEVPFAQPGAFDYEIEMTPEAIALLRRYGHATGPRHSGLYQVHDGTRAALKATLDEYAAAHDGKCPIPKPPPTVTPLSRSIIGASAPFDEAVTAGPARPGRPARITVSE